MHYSALQITVFTQITVEEMSRLYFCFPGAVPVRVQPAGVCSRGVDPDVVTLHSEGAEAFCHGPAAAGPSQP